VVAREWARGVAAEGTKVTVVPVAEEGVLGAEGAGAETDQAGSNSVVTLQA